MKIRTYEVYKTFWKCRDLEIEHYWHRIIFMTAFMLGAFASYGGWLSIIFSKDYAISFNIGNGVAFYITVIGMIVSALWIMMAKGSKAWYEEYENIINAFTNKKCRRIFFRKEIRKYVGLEYGTFPDITDLNLNDFLWSTKAGAFSVSKIGVAIGHCAALIWIALAVVHLILAKSCSTWEQARAIVLDRWCSLPYMTVVGTIILVLFWLYAKSQLFSGYFTKRKLCP